MIRIEICVGSSCHLKGSANVVKNFQKEIKKYGLENNSSLELAGSFCQGECLEGVVVKINEKLLTKVTPQKVPEIFQKNVLKELMNDASNNNS